MLMCRTDDAAASGVPPTPGAGFIQRVRRFGGMGGKSGTLAAKQTECPSRRFNELVNHSPAIFFPVAFRGP
jgi:hypothetical protein